MTKHQKNILEKLLHQACVLRDGERCLKCGRRDRLSASHIYPKGRYQKMRFDLDNVKSLCFQCHMAFWHKDIEEAHEWLHQTLDKKRLDRLKLRSLVNDTKPLDYNAIKLYLTNEIKKYGRNQREED